MKKRILSLTVVLCMVMTMFSVVPATADGKLYTVSFTPTITSTYNNHWPDVDFSTFDTFDVRGQGGSERYGYMKFERPIFKNSVVLNAALTLTTSSVDDPSGELTIDCTGICNNDWTAKDIICKDYNGEAVLPEDNHETVYISANTVTEENTEYTWDVTDYIKTDGDSIYTFKLHDTDEIEGTVLFHAKGTDYEPRLRLTIKTSDPIEVEYGDANGDDSIDVSDVVLLVDYIGALATGEEFDSEKLPYGTAHLELTGDGEIDISDIVMLVEYIGTLASGEPLDPEKFPNGTFPGASDNTTDMPELEEKLVITSNEYHNTVETDDRAEVYYYIGDVEKSFTFDSNGTVYINGVKTIDSITHVLDRFYGTAEFSKTGDEFEFDYDTVHISNYTTTVVDAVDTETSRVISKNSRTLQYANADNYIDATLYDSDGSEMNWEDLKEWDIVSYTKGDTGNKLIIVGQKVENAVTGTVLNVNGNECTIGGNKYRFSSELLGDMPWEGDEGTFYFDILGNIVRYELSLFTKTEYAYVNDAYIIQDFDDTLVLQLFKADGSIEDYKLINIVRYNDKTYNAWDMATQKFADELSGQFIRVEINKNGEIGLIETPTTWTSVSKRDEFTIYGTEVEESLFTKAAGSLVTSKSRVYTTPETKIFVLGEDRSTVSVIDASSLEDNDILKNVTFYDVNENLEIGAVLVKGGIIRESGDDDEQLPVTIVSPIAVAITADDTDDASVISLKAFSELYETTFLTDRNYIFEAPVSGSVYIPEFTEENTVKSYKTLVVTNLEDMTVARGEDAIDSDSPGANIRYYFENIKDVNGKRVTLDDGNYTDLVVPATANVYVVDGRIPTLTNRVFEGDIHYLDYNGEEKVFEDGGEKVSDYVIFAREVDGKISDVVLYINYSLIK